MTSSYLSMSTGHGPPGQEMGESHHAAFDRFKPAAKLTLMRYFQDLQNAEIPPSPVAPRYHTGRLPNSKAGDGKPRLLLMGQRR